MSEFNYLIERNAAQQIDERVARAQRGSVTGRRSRRTNRHSLARGLHRIADALDG